MFINFIYNCFKRCHAEVLYQRFVNQNFFLMASSSKIRDILIGFENKFNDSYSRLCELTGIENYFLKTKYNKIEFKKKVETKKETYSALSRFSKSNSEVQKSSMKIFSVKHILPQNKSPGNEKIVQSKDSETKTSSDLFRPFNKKKKLCHASTELNKSLSNVAPGFVYEPKKKKKRNRNRNNNKYKNHSN